MIDIHSHIIYDIDDGPSKIEDSIRMISEAEKMGIRVITSTIHYHEKLYNLEKTFERYQKVARRADDFGISLKLGYEVFINSIDIENLLKFKSYTMNMSNYMLIEFPYFDFCPEYIETLYMLQLKGIIPIIAHPERCRYFIENSNILDSFLEGGCLLQIDAASIIGIYGRHAKNLSKSLIKNQKATFVASNAHFAEDYSEWYLKAYNKVKQWAGEEYSQKVFNANAECITKGIGNANMYCNMS